MSEYVIESLTELFHLVKSLIPEDQEIVGVTPDTPVKEAVGIMEREHFSQLPVVQHGYLLGVFSYTSFTAGVLRMGSNNVPFGELPVDEFVEDLSFVQPSENWEMILDYLNADDAVLVGGRDELEGLVTTWDVLAYLRQVASPFVLLAEIEQSLRRIVRACVTPEELRMCAVNSLLSKYGDEEAVPSELKEMTFNDYAVMITSGDNWPHFTQVFGESDWARKTTNTRLIRTRQLRNDIFHFKRKIEREDVDRLKRYRDWLQRRARAFEARRRAEVEGEPTAEAPTTPSGKKWDEQGFFETLRQNASPAEVEAARKLLEWGRERMPEIWWGEGEVYGTFIPGLTHEGIWHQVAGVWTNGYVELKFQYMKGKPVFDEEESRLELLRRFNQVPGIHLARDRVDGRPSIPLATLVDEEAMATFIRVLEWFVDSIQLSKEGLADRHFWRYQFWRELLEKAEERTLLHADVSPSKNNWLTAGAGVSGITYNYAIRMDDARVELYIDRGSEEENAHIFETLAANREEIEERFGGPLEWLPLDGRRGCKVQYLISDSGGLRDRDAWPELQDKMIDAMVRLSEAFQPEITSLRL